MESRLSVRRIAWLWSTYDDLRIEHSAAVIFGGALLLVSSILGLLLSIPLIFESEQSVRWAPWFISCVVVWVAAANLMAWGAERSSQYVEGALPPPTRGPLRKFLCEDAPRFSNAWFAIALVLAGLCILYVAFSGSGWVAYALAAAHIAGGITIGAMRHRLSPDTGAFLAIILWAVAEPILKWVDAL